MALACGNKDGTLRALAQQNVIVLTKVNGIFI